MKLFFILLEILLSGLMMHLGNSFGYDGMVKIAEIFFLGGGVGLLLYASFSDPGKICCARMIKP